MHIEETQDKFIQFRAEGWSLGHIATELHVSKRTLVEWNRHFATDIQAVRTVELELLQEKFAASREEELTGLLRLQKDIEDELANRPLKFVPIEKLFRLATDLRHEIQQVRADLAGDAEMPPPECRRQNGNGHGGPRLANSRRPAGRTVAQEPCGDALVVEAPPSPLEAPASKPPPAPPVTQPPARNEMPTEKLASSTTASAPAEPSNHIAPVTASLQATNSPHDRNGESGIQVREASTKPVAEPVARAKPPQAQTELNRNPQEHCLACGAELPVLLLNGERPSHYCECGQSLTLPGLSLREHCPQCGVALPVHGYNAQRLSDTCPACAAALPPLDPNAFAPWISPAAKPNIRRPGKP